MFIFYLHHPIVLSCSFKALSQNTGNLLLGIYGKYSFSALWSRLKQYFDGDFPKIVIWSVKSNIVFYRICKKEYLILSFGFSGVVSKYQSTPNFLYTSIYFNTNEDKYNGFIQKSWKIT